MATPQPKGRTRGRPACRIAVAAAASGATRRQTRQRARGGKFERGHTLCMAGTPRLPPSARLLAARPTAASTSGDADACATKGRGSAGRQRRGGRQQNAKPERSPYAWSICCAAASPFPLPHPCSAPPRFLQACVHSSPAARAGGPAGGRLPEVGEGGGGGESRGRRGKKAEGRGGNAKLLYAPSHAPR